MRPEEGTMQSRAMAMAALLELLTDQPVVICNGFPSREAQKIADRPTHFYMIGSMGLGRQTVALEALGVDQRAYLWAPAWTTVALAYLVVFGSLVAFTAFSWLLGVAPVSTVSTYAYVNPVVAVLLGVLIAGESVEAVTVVGGAVTVLAVAVVVSEQGRRRPRGAEAQLPFVRQSRERSSRT